MNYCMTATIYINIAGELKLIYFLCTFEMIILEKDDWCQLLTDEEREILEYHNDMKVMYCDLSSHWHSLCVLPQFLNSIKTGMGLSDYIKRINISSVIQSVDPIVSTLPVSQ